MHISLVGYWQVQCTSGMCGGNNQTCPNRSESWQSASRCGGGSAVRLLHTPRNVLPRSPIRVWWSSHRAFVTPKRPNWRSPSAGTAVCERASTITIKYAKLAHTCVRMHALAARTHRDALTSERRDTFVAPRHGLFIGCGRVLENTF